MFWTGSLCILSTNRIMSTVTISSSVWVCSVCLCLSHTLLPLPAPFIIKTNNIYSNLCWLQKVYLSSELSILVLGPTQPPLQWVSSTLSPGLKWLGCETDQSLPLNVKVTNDWSHTYTFPCAFITFRETTLPWLHSCLYPVVLFLVIFLITLNQMSYFKHASTSKTFLHGWGKWCGGWLGIKLLGAGGSIKLNNLRVWGTEGWAWRSLLYPSGPKLKIFW